jgi:hypothetical protein
MCALDAIIAFASPELVVGRLLGVAASGADRRLPVVLALPLMSGRWLVRLRPLLAIVRGGLEDVGVPGLPVKVVGGLGVVEARAILLPWRWLGRLGRLGLWWC